MDSTALPRIICRCASTRARLIVWQEGLCCDVAVTMHGRMPDGPCYVQLLPEAWQPASEARTAA